MTHYLSVLNESIRVIILYIGTCSSVIIIILKSGKNKKMLNRFSKAVTFRLASSVDLIRLLLEEQSDQGLHCCPES